MHSDRVKILAELERIIGRKCYNGFIQNWGPGGVYKGEGRWFRYPLTMPDDDGSVKERTFQPADNFSDDELMSGTYVFGANKLAIMVALDEALQHLEDHYGFKLPSEA